MNGARGDGIAPFYAMEVMKAAKAREAIGHTVLHMELGEPCGGAPQRVINAARALLESPGRSLGYTQATGILELRQRIASHYGEAYGVELEPERVIVTASSSAAFLLGFLAVFEDGARIGLTEPGYPAYRNIVAAVGMEPVGIMTGPDTRYRPTREVLDGVGELDGLLLASPANPTGTMLDRSTLIDLVGWARERNVQLISDEVYHGITYGEPAVSLAGLTTEGIVVNSFSKYFAMTGWRLGWLVAPHDLVQTVERLAQNLFISPPALAQHAAVVAFDCKAELDQRVAGYARNRALFLDALPKAGFNKFAPVDGAFYVFADVSGLTNDSAAFCNRMLEQTGVAATPGIDFDPKRGKGFLRFSIAGSETDIVEAANRLIAWQAGNG